MRLGRAGHDRGVRDLQFVLDELRRLPHRILGNQCIACDRVASLRSLRHVRPVEERVQHVLRPVGGQCAGFRQCQSALFAARPTYEVLGRLQFAAVERGRDREARGIAEATRVARLPGGLLGECRDTPFEILGIAALLGVRERSHVPGGHGQQHGFLRAELRLVGGF